MKKMETNVECYLHWLDINNY